MSNSVRNSKLHSKFHNRIFLEVCSRRLLTFMWVVYVCVDSLKDDSITLLLNVLTSMIFWDKGQQFIFINWIKGCSHDFSSWSPSPARDGTADIFKGSEVIWPKAMFANILFGKHSTVCEFKEEKGVSSSLPSRLLMKRTWMRSQRRSISMTPSIIPLQQKDTTSCHSDWFGSSSSAG